MWFGAGGISEGGGLPITMGDQKVKLSADTYIHVVGVPALRPNGLHGCLPAQSRTESRRNIRSDFK